MAEEKQEHPVRKLIVTGQEQLATLGNGSTLYEVYATDEHGQAVEQPLRAFMELDQGEVRDYEVRPYDHEDYGRTFTLIPKQRESRSKKLAKEVKELRERLTELENSFDERVKALTQEMIEAHIKFGDKPF